MGLVAKDPMTRSKSMTLQGMSLERLMDRETLRASMDQMRRDADATGQMEGLDAFNRQALQILSDGGLADALDISKEDPKIAERYGVNDPAYQRDGAPKMIRNFLVARRLVEAGRTRCVIELQPLGLARRRRDELPTLARGDAAARSGAERADQRPARTRHARRCVDRHVGRVRAHAEDQQDTTAATTGRRRTSVSSLAAA